MEERLRDINGKQRLYLFNSREYNYRIQAIPGTLGIQKMDFPKKVEELYWAFFGRPPTQEESGYLLGEWQKCPGKARWQMTQDLVWALANSQEFITQH